jgi:hypothetical protein
MALLEFIQASKLDPKFQHAQRWIRINGAPFPDENKLTLLPDCNIYEIGVQLFTREDGGYELSSTTLYQKKVVENHWSFHNKKGHFVRGAVNCFDHMMDASPGYILQMLREFSEKPDVAQFWDKVTLKETKGQI